MIKGKYILVNGSFIASEDYKLSLEEAESKLLNLKIRAIRSSFPFFDEYLERIKKTLEFYNKSYNIFTDNNGQELKHQLLRTLTKNKFFLGAVLNLTFTNFENKLSYSLSVYKTEDPDFSLNSKGVFAEFCSTLCKPVSFNSWLLAESELYWIIALSQIEYSPDTVLLLSNSENKIIEAVGSNIYLVKGNQVFGVEPDSGAYTDISKSKIIEIIQSLNLQFVLCRGFSIYDLEEADELFTVNAVDGIKWVVGFEDKRYFNNVVKKISSLFGV